MLNIGGNRSEFLKYIAFGAMNTAITSGLFLYLSIGNPFAIAFSISFVLGITLNIYLMPRYVFSAKSGQYSKVLLGVVQLILYVNGLMLSLFLEAKEITNVNAAIWLIAINTPLSFFGNRIIIFIQMKK